MITKPLVFNLILCSLLGFSALHSQTLILEAKVIDSQTQMGIPYVNIGFPSYSIGTASNEKGDFIIKIPKERQLDTLTFSCIGYGTYRMALRGIDPKVFKTVQMKPADINLSEVVIKSLDAQKIIKTAMQQRDRNYNTQPVQLQAFVREILKEKDTERYFYNSEGIVEVYKSSVKKTDDQVRLVKGRKKKLEMAFEHSGKKYFLPTIVNGPTAAVTLDIVKNPQSFLLHSEQFHFIHTGYESINDRLHYIIYFTPRDSSKRALYPQDADFVKGKIYIDTANYAIVRAEFDLSIRGIRASNVDFYNNRLDIELVKRHYVVNYMEYQNRLYFKSVNVENTYKYRDSLIGLTNKIECLVTRIDFDHVNRFPLKEQINESESLGENIAQFDDSFWEDFNFIKSSDTEGVKEATDPMATQEQKEKIFEKQTEKKVKEILSQQTQNSVRTRFFEGSFAEAKELAAKENKLIFIDVYTDWCKPCKQMDMEAFNNPEIAELMNAFFVNYKADAEKSGRNIATNYSVEAYPTTLVVDSKGVLIRSFRGYNGVLGFKSQLESVVLNRPLGNAFLPMRDHFYKKQWDLDFLLGYAQVRKKIGLSNDDIFNTIVKELPSDTLLKIGYEQFLFQYFNGIEGQAFNFILEHKNESIFETKLKLLIATNINLAIKTKDKSLLEKILAANTRIINDPSVSEESNLMWTLKYHEKVSKDKTYHESANQMMNNYYLPKLDAAKSQNNNIALTDYMTKIEQLGLHYVVHIKDKKYLEQMANLIHQACQTHECGPLLSTYSQLLYRMKETDKAKELMQKAINLSNNDKNLVEILNKMNANNF
ncbi:MAG: carboxypeptidase-like regulatory domain-containing protein [Saprospiraceae bacterium]|nr:carboxypeptidase-like regulatory domain-containing protein [Saprospiraceae bacterium]